ncbi:MAG: PAS domain S-box protein [Candidatus Cloacimonetes bacterium]|nr:PAS domain S-box protein [Candidatus Cloacimonadota bacterium]
MKNNELNRILEFLNVAVFKRISNGKFHAVTSIPEWMTKLNPKFFSEKKEINLRKYSPFLDNFLYDAESFWEKNNSSKISSGSWIETNETGEDFFMEATALNENEENILMIELSRYSYQEKQTIIQKGRDIGLEYRDLAKLHNQLKEREKQFSELFESSPDAIFVEDCEGNVLDVNNSACKLHGIEKGELIGKNVKDLIPTEFVDKVCYEYTAEFELNKPFRKEGFCFNSEGKSIPVEINGTHVEYAGKKAILLHVRDITDSKNAQMELHRHKEHLEKLVQERTAKLNNLNLKLQNEINERKFAQKALQESRDKYVNLFQGLNDIIIICNSTGKILEVNKKACEIFDYSVEEFNKMNISDLLSTDSMEQFNNEQMKLLEVGYILFEIDFIKKDGSIFNTEISSSLFKFNGQEAIQSVIRDVTQRNNLEAQLRQSQKMEAVGRLAGGVAHDFNNLLTVIMGYTEIILSSVDEKDPFYIPLTQVREASYRASSLTRQLLTFSRKEVVQNQIISVNCIIRNMEKMLNRLIQEDIMLDTILDDEIGMIKADIGHVEQVVMNLVVNAKDAMPQGGLILISSQKCIYEKDTVVDKMLIPAGNYVKIIVQDNGVGMSNEVKNRIFEPFFTTKSEGKGTGLGLSTVYGIINQFNGYIAVDSEVGEGTSFHIYIPETTEEITTESTLISMTEKLKGKETILVVEDESLVRNLTCKILENNGYNVLEASHGGIALLKVEKKKIDLVLTDIVMPEMSGPELIERIRKMCPEISVLYMSGYTDDSVVKYGVLADNVQYINKPFNSKQLLSKIRDILDKRARNVIEQNQE